MFVFGSVTMGPEVEVDAATVTGVELDALEAFVFLGALGF